MRHWAMAMVLLLTAQAGAQELGPRFTDSLRGLSLQPPAGAEMRRETGGASLVQFSLRDGQTGAVAVSMYLLEATVREGVADDLAAYAQALAEDLRREQGYALTAEAVQLTTVAGQPAIDLRGPIGQVAKTYCRQVWIQREPGHFLVVQVRGPLDQAPRVNRLSDASLATLELFDPDQARRQREQDLARGSDLLAGLTLERFRQVIAPRDYWLAVLQKGRMIGFVHYTESLGTRLEAEGLLIERETVLTGPDGSQTLSKEVLFATPDRQLERYDTQAVLINPSGQSTPHREFGLKQADLLLVQVVTSPTTTADKQLQLPAEIYLPLAMSPLAPRLVDLDQPGSYGFAVYNPAGQNIELRTLTVVGSSTVRLGGQEFPATLLTDQMALDAPRSRVYVDAVGLPLRIEAEDGTVLQQTTAQAILAQFRNQYEQVRKLAR